MKMYSNFCRLRLPSLFCCVTNATFVDVSNSSLPFLSQFAQKDPCLACISIAILTPVTLHTLCLELSSCVLSVPVCSRRKPLSCVD